MRILLDTCTILWSVLSPEKLTKAAAQALENREAVVKISPVCCIEIACLVERKKIKLDRHWKIWFRHFKEINGWELLELDLSILEEAYSLPSPFHADPVDRILVATCRILDCKIVTADRKILEYPHVDSIW